MATYADLPPEIEAEIGTYLDPVDLAALARVRRQSATLKPTLNQCCLEPSSGEIAEWLQSERRSKFLPTVDLDYNGEIIRVRFNYKTNKWFNPDVFKPEEFDVDELPFRLAGMRLLLPDDRNIIIFLSILRKRKSCRDITFIKECLYSWLLHRFSEPLPESNLHQWHEFYEKLASMLPRHYKIDDYWEQISASALRTRDYNEALRQSTLIALESISPDDFIV